MNPRQSKFVFLLLIIVSFLFNSCNDQYPELDSGLYTEITTTKGNIVIQLEMEKTYMKHNKEDDYEDYNDVSGTLINKKELRQIIDNEYLK